MRRCFADFQFPCRWVPDMGYGNGFPLFNYYPPLPYYIGAVLSFAVGYLTAAKLLFLIPLIVGTVGFSLLAKQIFKDENTSLLATVLYLFAPYRALDTYVRGAVAESLAMALAPLMFYFALRLIRAPSKTVFLGLVLSISSLMLSHNIMTLFFLPLLIGWIILWVILEKQYKKIKLVGLSLLIGVGLSVFFTLPAFIEKDLVTTETLTRFDLNFRVHFTTFPQLFLNPTWGYGASTYGPDDTMSFQVGWPHWWLVVVSILTVIYGVWRRRIGGEIWVYIFLATSFLGSVMMTHNKSAFVWEAIPILQFVQFPWRFLSITILTSSLLGAIFLRYFTGKLQSAILIGVIFMTFLLNGPFFKPETYYPNITERDKLSGKMWEEQQKAGVLDYLPKTATQPLEVAPNMPVINGQGEVSGFINKTNRWLLSINVTTPTVVEVPVFDFPNWRVYINNQLIPHNHDNHLGRISFILKPGSYQVIGRFEDSPVRKYANLVSLVSLTTLGLLLWKKLKVL